MLSKVYPEMAAGGFTHDDQIMAFYLRVRALLKPESTVLDFGAGRGLIADYSPSFARNFRILKGDCAKVIGIDVDAEVLKNPTVDEAYQICDGRIPLADASVDLVVASAVFEHIEDPAAMASELHRVLKPGGWVCGWTVAKWGYVALGARLSPERLHYGVLRMLEPNTRGAKDVFPAYYRLNTLSAIRRAFDRRLFEDRSYYIGGTPSYHANRSSLIRTLRLYNNAVPAPLKKNLHIFVKKIGQAN